MVKRVGRPPRDHQHPGGLVVGPVQEERSDFLRGAAQQHGVGGGAVGHRSIYSKPSTPIEIRINIITSFLRELYITICIDLKINQI